MKPWQEILQCFMDEPPVFQTLDDFSLLYILTTSFLSCWGIVFVSRKELWEKVGIQVQRDPVAEFPLNSSVFHVEFLLKHISATFVLILVIMLEIKAAVFSFHLCRAFSLLELTYLISLYPQISYWLKNFDFLTYVVCFGCQGEMMDSFNFLQFNQI